MGTIWTMGTRRRLSLDPIRSKRQVGILGMGRIGETIAKRALGFDATIHYHSRTPKDVDFIYHITVNELAAAVDVLFVITLVVHRPITW